MVRALLLQLVYGSIEREPLSDTQRKLAFLFHLLISEEVFPVGVVLGRRDAPAGCVFERQFGSAAPLSLGGRRNFLADQAHGSLAQNASRLAFIVAVDLASMRVWRLRGDARSFECRAIDNGNVTVHAIKDCRMVPAD